MQIAVASGKNKIQLYISFSKGLIADNDSMFVLQNRFIRVRRRQKDHASVF